MTFNVYYVGSKYPYFISNRGYCQNRSDEHCILKFLITHPDCSCGKPQLLTWKSSAPLRWWCKQNPTWRVAAEFYFPSFLCYYKWTKIKTYVSIFKRVHYRLQFDFNFWLSQSKKLLCWILLIKVTGQQTKHSLKWHCNLQISFEA